MEISFQPASEQAGNIFAYSPQATGINSLGQKSGALVIDVVCNQKLVNGASLAHGIYKLIPLIVYSIHGIISGGSEGRRVRSDSQWSRESNNFPEYVS
jgi:hypothetical protein